MSWLKQFCSPLSCSPSPARALTYEHPGWQQQLWHEAASRVFSSAGEMVEMANQLAWRNVQQHTGGPFGAVVVNSGTGRIVGWGTNTVVHSSCIFHAETVALWDASRLLGRYDLGSTAHDPLILAVSAQPCAMCTGAIVWSGIKELIFGASTADVEEHAGFDEGPQHPEWQKEFGKRGIKVTAGVLREKCIETLVEYKRMGGEVYNGGKVVPT